MSRELDWRIHELMGNDLTGFDWAKGSLESAVLVTETGVKWVDIPHYSSTWEGAGLVMEWTKRNKPHWNCSIGWDWMAEKYAGSVCSRYDFDESGPLALAKAYISAMEER